jgi:ketosteroid isomerase-like protein
MTGGRPASRQQGGSRRALVAAAPETFGVPAYVGRHGWVSIQLATVDPTDVKAAMSDLDDFLATTLDRQIKAEEAVHNGDLGPRPAMWSTKDPVTVFGAVRSATGLDGVSQLFGWLGEHFSDCTAYRFELVAAGVSGELAYTVGYQHTSASWGGVPLEPYTPRVTHAYRREDGEWKIVHRHADAVSVDEGTPAKPSTG